MAFLRSFLLILLFLIQVYGLPDCPSQIEIALVDQPQNISVCIGRQARINCTYTGTASVPLWFINSTLHTPNDLPPHHTYNGRTLIINDVFPEENDTTYQCFFQVVDNNGSLCQLKSTIGKLTVLTNDACEHLGPENITRREGATNVVIPCAVSGYNPPVWVINGLVYELFQLPDIFTPTYGGIVIKVVQANLNGVSFHCLISTDTGYLVEARSTGYITVTPRGGSQEFNEDTSDLYIDHQKTSFNQGLTLSWKPLNNVECSDYEVTSRRRCGRTSPVENAWHITEPSINISAKFLHINQSEEIEIQADFIIKAVDDDGFVCSFTKATMQVQKETTTRQLDSSFSKSNKITFFTLKNSTFYLVLPRMGTVEDCFCPIIFQIDAHCYNVNNCFCLDDTLFYNSMIEFCYVSVLNDSILVSMQIQNMTSDMHGHRLSIVHVFFCQYNFLPPYRVYTNSFQIAIVLPEPPIVKFNGNTSEVCIMPYSENSIPPDTYSIRVNDITGESVFLKNISASINSTICETVLYYNQHSNNCAPLLATVSAITTYGQVNTTISPYSENMTGDACLCLNETVNITVTTQENADENTILLMVLCHQSKYLSDFKLQATICPEQRRDVLCNNSEMIEFNGLSCDTNYNVSIFWESSDMYCLFSHNKVQLPCKSNKGNNDLAIILGVVLPITVIMLSILFVLLCIGCWKCRRRTSSQQVTYTR